jgi:S-adenosylmethionine synthetase
MKKDFMFTSESVTEGHPDKAPDKDVIVDRFSARSVHAYHRGMRRGAFYRLIAARFNSNITIDFPNVARQVISMVGHDQRPFSSKTCSIVTSSRNYPWKDSNSGKN